MNKLDNIEKDNNDLRRKIDEYDEEMKVKWENFKVKMNHDANEISIELKNISLSSKK